MTRLVAVRRNFPTLVLLLAPVRWVGRSRRRVLGTVIFLIAMVAAPPIWWKTQLAGLPDIGEPFDIATFRTLAIPDDRNAFVLYRQAAALQKPLASYTQKAKNNRVNVIASWSKAVPELHQWVEDNRPALALYRQGAERPDALDVVANDERPGYKTIQALVLFRLMGLLEASRLEEKHEMVGAWGWYRAVLRSAHHVSMRSSISRRAVFALAS